MCEMKETKEKLIFVSSELFIDKNTDVLNMFQILSFVAVFMLTALLKMLIASPHPSASPRCTKLSTQTYHCAVQLSNNAGVHHYPCHPFQWYTLEHQLLVCFSSLLWQILSIREYRDTSNKYSSYFRNVLCLFCGNRCCLPPLP